MANPIEYLKGVGPQKADLLKKELGIFTFNDLLHHFPYRHVDKTRFSAIIDLTPANEYVQVRGILTYKETTGEKQGRRLLAYLRDETGTIELTWFKGLTWVDKLLREGERYTAFGRLTFFLGKPQLTHPEIEAFNPNAVPNTLEPVYSTTEKLKARGLGGRPIGKLVQALLELVRPSDLPENLPEPILRKGVLMGRYEAYRGIHFPRNPRECSLALRRLKFEELFLAQVRLARVRSERHRLSRGVIFNEVGELFNTFYKEHLPFSLTGAQKRVLKEVRTDTASGHQMNRLLQGDVGSGKTIVALLAMLLAVDNGYQACLMAPTEILAQQHYRGLSDLLSALPVPIRILTGSTKTAERKEILRQLLAGDIRILVGTHALIEEVVQFRNLGLAIVDEQHRFGVAQRARLWKKAPIPPHVLVMTATPIPRTLAMTAYGDLDCSVMDELPPGRQPVLTVHRLDDQRSRVMEFIRGEIDKGRQVYVIFPLIEESEKLDYEDLMKGYENIKAYFPEPRYWISMVHGRQAPDVKETNMQRFVKGETHIMVSTTVIEVGVNVPNASVMVIESAEKFGLSQLHQLRGRVGRGAEKSYCVLMTGPKLSNDARERLRIMCATNSGFEIAEKDLELRGPGEIEGTRQSGTLNLKLADLVKDKAILDAARAFAEALIETDPELEAEEQQPLKHYLMSLQGKTPWSRIS
ncbi:ATP-dependent DNA helicase RecG [Flaviaesturariibacter amylovorans]|uniref:ATP-dependent DNA helicase RecG n=1 Tax=Flaviaesturariibacter amylovorans TaxID=1084520 RepID=UPI0031EE41BF